MFLGIGIVLTKWISRGVNNPLDPYVVTDYVAADYVTPE